jgi:uncharacterized protein
MTSTGLLALIVGGLLLQVLGAVGVALRRRSLRLAAVPVAPATVEPQSPAAWPGWRALRVLERHFEDPHCSQCSFVLAPVDGPPLPDFRPGQFLTFRLTDTRLPRDVVRCYSLSAAAQADRYRVTIKRVPNGLASNHFHDQVQVGSVLQVRAPAGQFFLDMDDSAPAVLLAGGIGITPMVAMLQAVMVQQPQRPVHLFYSVRHPSERAFGPWLQAQAAVHPALRLHLLHSPTAADEPPEPGATVGRIDTDLLRRTLPHGRHTFYLCGPPAMMDSLVPALRAWGVAASDIHFEAFGPASVNTGAPQAMAADEPPQAVEFRRSGRTLPWTGRDATLLDFAEREGIVIDAGCRSGGCGTCQTRLLSGALRYATTPDFTPEAGCCLPCIGRPDPNAGALVLEL